MNRTLHSRSANQVCAHKNSLRVEVERLTIPSTRSRVLALAWVRIATPHITFSCGPWRVLERLGTDPAVLPPDVREGGRWVETVKLPALVVGIVENAVLASFREQDQGGTR